MRKLFAPLLIAAMSGLLLISGLPCALAGTPAVHISARPAWLNPFKLSDKKLPARQVTNGFFYQLFEEQIQVEKQADYKHVIREIVSEAGIQNGSEISISFDPSYERLDVHDITVWRNGKAESRLGPKSFKVIADEKDLSKFIYQGSFSALCILDDIRKGDRIEYAYTIIGRNPIFGNKYTDELYMQGIQPYAQLYKALLVSPNRKLNFKAFGNAALADPTDKNGLKCYEWNLLQVMPPPDAYGTPSWFNNYNYIQVSDYGSWQEVIDWALKVNPVATSLKGSLAARVAKLKAYAAGDKEKYFRSAVQMVQDEIRYMGIELGEYSHRANTPEKVYNQRYGDCKDKALLLASVLMANGIDAHMVLINTDAEAKIDAYIPSPTVFDHAVCVVTINNKPVYIDATIAYQRGSGTNLYFPNYGKGLVLMAGNTSLTAITPTRAGKMMVIENYKVPAGEKESTLLEVTTTYTLDEADRMRDRLATGSIAETEKNYLDYYAKSYPKIEFAADSITVKDDVIKNELVTIEYYRIPGFFKADKEPGKYTASFYAGAINDQLPGIAGKAQMPAAINYPVNIEHVVHVIMKSGWDIAESNSSIQRDAYTFNSRTLVQGDTLTLDYNFRTLKDFIAPDKLDEARADVKQIADNELGYSFTYTPDISRVPFRPNYSLMIFVLVLVATLTWLAIKLYRTETHAVVFERGANFIPVRGWLILIAIGLAITPFAVAYTMADSGYLDLSKWNAHPANSSDVAFKALFLFEVAGNVILIAFAAFCFVLLVNRRDVLPRYIIGFYAFVAVFAVSDYFLVIIVNGSVLDSMALSMIRKIIYSGIWIAYFKSSERVEQTFVVPYPADNYSYEETEEEKKANLIA
jgi:hypothetical protein